MHSVHIRTYVFGHSLAAYPRILIERASVPPLLRVPCTAFAFFVTLSQRISGFSLRGLRFHPPFRSYAFLSHYSSLSRNVSPDSDGEGFGSTRPLGPMHSVHIFGHSLARYPRILIERASLPLLLRVLCIPFAFVVTLWSSLSRTYPQILIERASVPPLSGSMYVRIHFGTL